MMKGLQYATVLLVLTVIAFWAAFGLDQPERPADLRVHMVGFDNRYGNVERLRIHVTVNGLTEQASVATCDPTMCTFELPLPDAVHEILISVEHDGRRSEPARVTLDTRVPTDR